MRNRLVLRPGFTLYSGTLPDTGLHAHAAATLIVASGSPFLVDVDGGPALRARSVLLDAGVAHRLRTGGGRVHVCFLEQHEASTQRLRRHFFASERVVVDPLAVGGRLADPAPALEAGDLEALLGRRWRHATPGWDERPFEALREAVRRAPAMATDDGRAAPRGALLATLADRAGLSTSRLRHLFREEFCVSFEHYRLWLQALGFVRTWRPGSSLTHHALDHGYFDSAHFSRTWRGLFGVTPSSVVRGLEGPTGALLDR